MRNYFNRLPKMIALAAMAFALNISGTSAAELKMAHFMSPKHPMHRFLMAPMAEELGKLSGGNLTIKIYPAGALGKGPREQYNRAVDHIADITFGLAGYTSPQFPRSLLAELPGVGASTAGLTKAMWKAYPLMQDDFKDVKLLALWTNDASVLITRDKPVRKLEDLKGLKIRVPSKLAASVVKAWGGVPQTMPVTKVYTALQTKVIDGVFIGASAIRSFKLAEVGKYFTTNLPSAFSVFYLVMNKDAWNGLSDAEKAMLDKVSGAQVSIKAATAYGKAGEAGMGVVKKAGREIIALSAAESKRFSDAVKPAVAAVITAREANGIPAKKIVETLKAGM